MLFTERSLWTMLHGLVLGGGALMGLAAALFALRIVPGPGSSHEALDYPSRRIAWLIVAVAVLLWLTVILGTYVTFPPYRATPPEGLTDLRQYPRALIRANPGTAWLHSFAMESKEHVPWIAAMLATAVAAIGVRYRTHFLGDTDLRKKASALLAICFVLVAYVSLLGVFVNKVAPLE